MKPGKTNKEDRINFIKFWAGYIKTHPDEDWSKQQNIVIDSQIESSNSIVWTKKQFETLRKLKIKQQSF